MGIETLQYPKPQAEEHLGPVEMEQLDLTGMPEEDIGEDVIFGEADRVENLESRQEPASSLSSHAPFGLADDLNQDKVVLMTEQQKQALREARSRGHNTTSEQAYAQMALAMGTPLRRIGMAPSGSGVRSTAGVNRKGDRKSVV